MPNMLEEQLRAIQNQRDNLKWKIKVESDGETIREMIKMVEKLNKEELELLKQMEVEI